VLQSIGLLLAEPNPDDGLMSDIVRAPLRQLWLRMRDTPPLSCTADTRVRCCAAPPQASEYKHARSVFDDKARRSTQQHACGTLAAQAGPSGAGGSGAAGAEAAAAPADAAPVQPQAAPAADADGSAAAAAAAPKRSAEAAAQGDGAAPAAGEAAAPAAAPPRKRLQLSRPAPPA
jgi:hypothetical protein